MPCYEPSYEHSKGDAILCSIFHTAERNQSLQWLIDGLDYNLIGLSKEQVVKWWEQHKELDREKLKAKH
jgi:hypothetical protein